MSFRSNPVWQTEYFSASQILGLKHCDNCCVPVFEMLSHLDSITHCLIVPSFLIQFRTETALCFPLLFLGFFLFPEGQCSSQLSSFNSGKCFIFSVQRCLLSILIFQFKYVKTSELYISERSILLIDKCHLCNFEEAGIFFPSISAEKCLSCSQHNSLFSNYHCRNIFRIAIRVQLERNIILPVAVASQKNGVVALQKGQ